MRDDYSQQGKSPDSTRAFLTVSDCRARGLDRHGQEGQPGGSILNHRGRKWGLGELLARNLDFLCCKKEVSSKPEDPDLNFQPWLNLSQTSNCELYLYGTPPCSPNSKAPSEDLERLTEITTAASSFSICPGVLVSTVFLLPHYLIILFY